MALAIKLNTRVKVQKKPLMQNLFFIFFKVKNIF